MFKNIRNFFKDDVKLSPALEAEFQSERARFADEYCKFILKYIGWSLFLLFWVVDYFVNKENSIIGLLLRSMFGVVSVILYYSYKIDKIKKHPYLIYTLLGLLGASTMHALSFFITDPRSALNYFIGFELIALVLLIVIQLPVKNTLILLFSLFAPHMFRIIYFLAPMPVIVYDGINTFSICIFIFTYRKYQLTQLKREFLIRYEQRLNADIGKNISEISHDIRAPLLALRTLQQGFFDPESAKDVLRITTGRLIELTENITQAASQLSVNIQRVELEVFFKECKEYVEFIHPQLGIQWDLLYKSKTFNFDRSKIKRVIINLINNAISATKHLSKPEIKVLVQEEQNQFIIKVIDNGKGVEPGSSFERGKSKFGSTGLGLSFVNRVAQEHGGKFVLQTKEGLTFATLLFKTE
ncbi:MAG: HAMP domain-containing histidine kinase [Oligoflexia bacterium]|nr:HAMP domain-containing histidine kinase [Oligoflexia bacterium]